MTINIVHSAGKCGSVSIKKAFRRAGLPIIHSHFMKGKTHPDERYHVITPIRELVAQNISAYFENIARYEPPSVRSFIKKWAGDKQVELFFETEFEPCWGIDVFQYPFDSNQGWQIYEKDNVKALVIRLEDFDKWEEAYFSLTGLEAPELRNDHKTTREGYEEFKKYAVLPDWYCSRLRQSKLQRHFYPEYAEALDERQHE